MRKDDLSRHKYTVEKLVETPSFRRWVHGQAYDQERLYWDRWVMKDLENRAKAMQAAEEITGLVFDLNDPFPATDKAWNRLRAGIEQRQKENRHVILFLTGLHKEGLSWAVRIAASLLLVLVSTYLITQSYQIPSEQVTELVERQIETESGEQKSIRLVDGSEIVLNGLSKIVYVTDKNDPTSIDVYLEGEAFFSVSRRVNPDDIPFQVRTDAGLITVLGTQFVVSTLRNQTRVALKEGSVTVSLFRPNHETTLVPGQMAEFNTGSDKIKTGVANLDAYTSWINGMLHFERAPIEEVIEQLERTFGVTVVIRDSNLYEFEVSGSIEGSQVEIITSALSTMLDTPVYTSATDSTIYVGDPQGPAKISENPKQ